MSAKPILVSVLITLAIIGSMTLYFTIHTDLENLAALQLRLLPDRTIFDDRVIPLDVFEGTHDIKKISSGEEVRNFLLKTRSQNSYVDYARLSEIVEWDSDSLKYPRPFSQQAQLQSGSPSFARSEGLDMSPGAPSVVIVDQAMHTTGDSSAYSSTNVQVVGVDEPDHIKTDGKYIYVLNDRTLTIIDGYPAENAKIVSRTNLDIQQQKSHNMFLNKDRLVIFYTASNYEKRVTALGSSAIVDSIITHAIILDVSDPESPTVIKDYEVDGDFHDARMIGKYVYLISTADANRNNLVLPRITEHDSPDVVMEPEIFYFDNYESDYIFNTITAIGTANENFVNSKTFLMGPTNTIYTSHDGLYITYKKSISTLHQDAIEKDRFFNVIIPLLPISVQHKITEIQNDTSITSAKKHSLVTEFLQETFDDIGYLDKKTLFSNISEQLALYDSRIRQDLESTIVHKIGINNGDIEHKAKGEIPGWLLNQFSMDEYNNSLRAVTTYENYEGDGRITRYNGVYVMDSKNLNMTGTLGGIAPNENVFSARFIGDRLYLVTFERVDPFFVIDLASETPKILGELKIPGFSNYLHPYGDDYIVGIGRDADNSGVQQSGVKIALFDVADVKNPSVVDEIVIGSSRQTGSEALDDHKAFFLDQTTGILSLPIYDRIDSMEFSDTQTAWYGFYVYGIDPQDGFELKGKIKHSESERLRSQTGYRSFFIDDALYTSSPSAIMINDLKDINNEINSIRLDHP